MNKNSRFWSNTPRPKAYLIAAGITFVAFLVRLVLHPHLQAYAPFQTFFLACLLTEYLVGFGPALFSLAFSYLLGVYYFIPPYGVFDGLISRSDVISALTFVLLTLFSIALIEYLQRTLYSRQLLLKVSQSHHRISLYRENDRLYLAKKAATAAHAFEKLFADFGHVLVLWPKNGEAYPQALLYELAGVSCDAKDNWQTLFDAERRTTLQNELALLDRGPAHHRQFSSLIRNARGETHKAELALERIVVGHETVTVLKLVSADPCHNSP